MKSLIYILALLLLSTTLYGKVRLEGSSTLLPIIKDIRKIYNNKNSIEVKGGGSEVGLSSLVSGECDIAMVSRGLTPEEISKGFSIHTIAYDGIAIIVNTSLRIDTITSKDVIDIYTGAETTWQKYTNLDEKITVVGKEEGRATLKVFEKFFKIKNMRKDTIFVGSNTEDIIYVSGEPAAIGYVSIGAAVNAKNKGSEIKLLNLDGIPATKENVSNHKYPIVRELNLVTYKESSQEVKDFIAFVKSPKGQIKVEKRDFVGIN